MGIVTKKTTRTLFLIALDILILTASVYVANLIRFDGMVPEPYVTVFKHTIFYIVITKLIVFWLMGLYSSLWRYAGISELLRIVMGVTFGTMMVIGITLFLPDVPFLEGFEFGVPRSIYVVSWLLDLIFVGGTRFSYRALRSVKRAELLGHKKKRALIVGAGDAGAMVIKELKEGENASYIPVAVIDDDVYKAGKRIHGVKVVGNMNRMDAVILNKHIDEIILAIPSLKSEERKVIIQKCEETGLPVKTVPKVYDIISGKVSVSDIRPVDVEDLLGREPVKLDMTSINAFIKDKRVMITGGGGSIGSELARQIVAIGPSELFLLDIYENNVYEIINELKISMPGCSVKGIIASVRDSERIEKVFDGIRPDVVFHAAAHKHVPLMERNPSEAVKNNILGTHNVVRASDRFSVERFVMISTDKAVNPTNIMGATKRFCEMIVEAYAGKSETVFAVTRFGNVLGSNGSVIPLFKRQISAGGPVTVTHPDIIRYFMTIPEAVQLVIQAGAISEGGELFVLDMGEQVKIDKLARDLIRMSGFEPDKDIKIVYTGLRPGEKLYEELLMAEEGLIDTSIDKLHVAARTNVHKDEIVQMMARFAALGTDDDGCRVLLREAVPTYQPSEG